MTSIPNGMGVATAASDEIERQRRVQAFGLCFAEARASLAVTQKELGDLLKLGTSGRAIVAKIEIGGTLPDAARLHQLLQVSVQDSKASSVRSISDAMKRRLVESWVHAQDGMHELLVWSDQRVWTINEVLTDQSACSEVWVVGEWIVQAESVDWYRLMLEHAQQTQFHLFVGEACCKQLADYWSAYGVEQEKQSKIKQPRVHSIPPSLEPLLWFAAMSIHYKTNGDRRAFARLRAAVGDPYPCVKLQEGWGKLKNLLALHVHSSNGASA